MAVTLKDVAARAGVSPIVVSHVLNNRAPSIRVSEATADRVRRAAQELGYRLNVYARNFRERQTMMIGVLHGIGFARPIFGQSSRYFGLLMDGIVDGAFRHGYSVTLCPKLLSQSPEDAMTDGRFDGLVWYSTVPTKTSHDLVANCSVPLVLIHARAKDFADKHPTVICDNDQGMALAMDHLVRLGHRRIAYALEGAHLSVEAVMRHDAFRRHAARSGLMVTDKDFIGVYDGYDEVCNYLEDGPRHTAIIAHNEWFAVQIMKQAIRLGIHVPGDLSIVGFDSTSFCDEQDPPLTSVRQPLSELGSAAIDMLVQVIGGQRPDPFEIVLPCGLDVRGSTGLAPDSD